MASINTLPRNANAAEGYTGVIDKPDAWTHGKLVQITKYVGQRSMGYKTDYQSVPCVWLVIGVEGQKSRATQFSGARLAKADKMWQAWKDQLLPHLAPSNLSSR